jgi:hypothetical protein
MGIRPSNLNPDDGVRDRLPLTRVVLQLLDRLSSRHGRITQDICDVKSLQLRDKSIRTDENGLICLTDIYKSGDYGANQTPNDWWRIHATQALAIALLSRLPGNTANQIRPICQRFIGGVAVSGVRFTRTRFWPVPMQAI